MIKAQHTLLIGGSAGSLGLIKKLLQQLPKHFNVPTIIVLHLAADTEVDILKGLNYSSNLPVIGARDKQMIESSNVYLAPGGYHVFIEKNGALALSDDEPVNYCKPSIDVLFSSAANNGSQNITAILFSGANADGAQGAWDIKQSGGQVWVQNPEQAEYSAMPAAAIERQAYSFIGSADDIINKTLTMTEMPNV